MGVYKRQQISRLLSSVQELARELDAEVDIVTAATPVVVLGPAAQRMVARA